MGELTAPLRGSPHQQDQPRTDTGPRAGRRVHLLPGRRSQQSRCSRLSLAVPTSPACSGPTPPPRLIPRCGNRTLKQVVTPAPGPAPRAALETSAMPVTKPCHPPRPHAERGEPGPASLSSALGHPLPAAPHTHPRGLRDPILPFGNVLPASSRHQSAGHGGAGGHDAGKRGLSAGHRAPSNPQSLPGG